MIRWCRAGSTRRSADKKSGTLPSGSITKNRSTAAESRLTPGKLSPEQSRRGLATRYSSNPRDSASGSALRRAAATDAAAKAAPIGPVSHPMLPSVPISNGMATPPSTPQSATRQSESWWRVLRRSASDSQTAKPSPERNPTKANMGSTFAGPSPGSMSSGSKIANAVNTTSPITTHSAPQVTAIPKAPRIRLARSRIGSEPRPGQLDVGPGPRLGEPLLHRSRFGCFPLGLERGRQPKQRPPVLGEPFQVFPVHRLGFGVPARLEQRRAERVTNRIVPAGRLEVEAGVLDFQRLAKMHDAFFEASAPGRDLPREGVRRHRHGGLGIRVRGRGRVDRPHGVQRYPRLGELSLGRMGYAPGVVRQG